MTDAISRGAVLTVGNVRKVVEYDEAGYDMTYDAVPVEAIEALPALDVAPVVHGHWVHCKGRSNLWYCSECGDKMLYNPTRRTYNIVKLPMAEKNKFCRNCGARMYGEADEI